jgi:hypothetical protein
VTPLRRDAAGAVDVAVYFDDPAAPDASAPQSPHIVSSNASDPYGGAPGTDGLFPYPVVTVAAGAELSLTASSRDADGDDLAYAWDFGPDAATGAIGPGGMASPLWSGDLATPAATTRYDRPGVYRVRVAFSDLRGRTSSSSVLVRVTGGTPDSTSADNIVTGRVVDAFGQPMADVRVGDGSRWTWTDSDGSYALAGLDAAARPLAASRPGGWAFEPVGFDNPVTPADFTRADFRGTPAEHHINGVVTSLAGFGVKDVLVSDGTRSTLTDGLGRFSLPEPDGVYDLTFDKPGFPISPAVGVAVDDADTFVPAEAHVDAVVGAVRGAPAGAATFVSYGGMQPGQQAFGGRYELADVPRGTWAFFGTATTPDRRQFFFLPAGRANPITIDGQQGPVDFQLIPAGTYLVTGRVTRGADAVPGVRVTAVDKVTNRVAATTVTDDSGRYVLPALPGGAYNVTARKEGLDLAPLGRRFVLSSYRPGVDFHVANPPPDLAPTLVEPASTDSPIVTGTSGWMSALAEDDRDTDRLVYTWSVVSAPAGASVAFSRNEANPAQRTLATFDRAGVYEIRSDVTDTAGNRATSIAAVTVAPVLSSVRLDAAYATVAAGTSRPYRAAALDQFGRPLTEAPAWSWEAVGGIGSVAPDGTFTAGDAASRGAVVVRASSSLGAAVGAATVDVKPYATVAARRIFYNNSVYDDFNAGANGTDFDAVAPDKRPLLPGDGAATAANYTAYDKGINGIMLDLDGAWATELTAADFQFLTGPGDAAEWVEAPRPRQLSTTTVQGDARP